ncbi:MAG: DUF58 domain-containing protein [Treponema sp.]|nr:DUF58 domain-containing protein [Treponema sp.]
MRRRNGLFILTPFLFLIFLFAPQFFVRFPALLLALVLLGSKLYSEYLLRNLGIIRRDGEIRCFKNEWAEIELVVENRGFLPVFMLAAEDIPGTMPVFRNNRRLCTLWGRSRFIFSWRIWGNSRGIFSIGPARLRFADPLGLFPAELKYEKNARFIVYPRAGMIAVKTRAGIPLGTLKSPNPLYEDMTRKRSLREYQSGDEMRRINWKASARMFGGHAASPFLVNEYDAAVSRPLAVFLNLDPASCRSNLREFYLERAIEAAAALCVMAARERQDLGIACYVSGGGGPVVMPAPFTVTVILEMLAGIRLTGEAAGANPGGGFVNHVCEQIDGSGAGDSVNFFLEKGKRLPGGTRIIYAGPNFSDGEYLLLDMLRQYRLSLEYIIIDERRLPPVVPGCAPRYQMKESGYDIL